MATAIYSLSECDLGDCNSSAIWRAGRMGWMYSVCNDTKWSELREAMLAFPADVRPRWRSLTLSGCEYGYDGEWFYHFRNGGYDDLQHVDIASVNEPTDAAVLAAIRKIGLAALRLEPCVWRVYGYVDDTNLARIP